jgi:hypothetical protein
MPRLELPVDVWTLVKGSRVARCEVARHPIGLELRCYVDGGLLRSQAFRDAEALELEAFAWKEAFGATGWRVPAACAMGPWIVNPKCA